MVVCHDLYISTKSVLSNSPKQDWASDIRMGGVMTGRDQLQETLCNRLFRHTAKRNNAKVADHLFHRREMDVVYAMDEATLFDAFFNRQHRCSRDPYIGFPVTICFALTIKDN